MKPLAGGARHSIGGRLGLLVFAVLVPLVGLQVVYLADNFTNAQEESLRDAARLAGRLHVHIDDLVGSIDGLLQTVAVAVPMRLDSIDAGNATLLAIRNGLPEHYGSVSLIQPDGTMLYSSESPPPRPGSFNVADRSYFRQVLASDDLHVSAPMISQTPGEWVAVMARPVKDVASGATVGVVAASIRLTLLQNVFRELVLPAGSIVTVFNRDGSVLARSRDPEQWVGKNISRVESTAQALRESEGVGEMISADGVVRFSAYASSTKAPWLVYVGIPTDVALDAARQDMWRYGLAAALVALFAIVVAVRIVRAREDESVRASETMLRQFVENAPAAIAVLDTEMRYLLTSHRWRTDFRLATEDVIGRCHYDVLPEVPEQWKATHRRCLAGAVESADEEPFLRADGTTEWVRWEVRPWYRAEGVVGGITIFRELITERKRAAEALRQTTLRLGAAVRGGNVGLWSWDLRTNEIYFSREWKSQIGYADEEISNHFDEWQSRVHPDDLQRTLDSLNAYINVAGSYYSTEFRIRHKAGSYRWIFSQASLEYDDNGTPVRMMGSHIDVTEMRVLLSEKIALGERIARLLESMNEGLFHLDAEGQFRHVNRRAAELLGRSPEDLIGKNVWRAFPEALGSAFDKACHEAQEQQRSVQVEQYYAPWSRWFECRLYALDGGVTVFFTDITARKVAESALQTSARDLRVLAARLADAQEAERRSLAGELHDQVGQNLTALNLTFSLLKGELTVESSAAAVSRIDSGIELVAETVGQVRDLMVELRPPMLDDYGLLAALRWYVGRFAMRCGITAHVDGSEPEPRLPGRVEIALFRIAQEALNNVVKHAGAQRVHVLFDTLNGVVEMSIEDDGRGFDIAATTQHTSGWGLAGMRERAIAVGGTVEFESIPGSGTRVIVRMDRT